MRMTHSFPFEQFQCDTRLRRRSDHGCLAIKGKKADETPGTKEMRQGLWGAQAVTCIVLLLSFSLSPASPSCFSISLSLAVNPSHSLSLFFSAVGSHSSSLFSTRFHRDLSSFGTYIHNTTFVPLFPVEMGSSASQVFLNRTRHTPAFLSANFKRVACAGIPPNYREILQLSIHPLSLAFLRLSFYQCII